MLKLIFAASLACLASFAMADYRHMDHSTQHHHPHSRSHHHEWRHR